MYNYSVKTQVSFEAAHRLYGIDTYSKACVDSLHGHSYKVTFYAGHDHILNNSDMVIDFKLLKTILRNRIEEKYDHSCILREDDPLCKPISELSTNVHIVSESPTAEWMAKEFFIEANEGLAKEAPGVRIYRVEVQETENNIAIYEEM